mmetsp:Transcript_41674/g.71333  ORF Transcript_41674/g.71333 Transcript_41674/m.71333 type:complete len:250 (+) Transcript_41674:19-768(+)
MSSLRQVSKKDSQGDIEAPSDDNAPKTTPTGVAPAGPRSHNPVFLAKIVCGKVVGLLTATDAYDDDGNYDLTKPSGMIIFLKEAVLGIILGMLLISAFITLDHLDIVHFEGAHRIRNAGFQLLNDPETIANLEEASEFKFMTYTDYENMQREIESAAEKISAMQADLEKQQAESEKKSQGDDVTAIKEEHERLMKLGNEVLHLDKFCGECSWKGGTSCQGRVDFLKDKYGSHPFDAMDNAMKQPGCVKA